MKERLDDDVLYQNIRDFLISQLPEDPDLNFIQQLDDLADLVFEKISEALDTDDQF